VCEDRDRLEATTELSRRKKLQFSKFAPNFFSVLFIRGISSIWCKDCSTDENLSGNGFKNKYFLSNVKNVILRFATNSLEKSNMNVAKSSFKAFFILIENVLQQQKQKAPDDYFECQYFEKKLFENGDFKIQNRPDLTNLNIHYPNPAGGPGGYPNLAGHPKAFEILVLKYPHSKLSSFAKRNSRFSKKINLPWM
jgi:hypothetical protein